MKGTAGEMVSEDGGQASVRTSNLREWEMKESAIAQTSSAVHWRYVNMFIISLIYCFIWLFLKLYLQNFIYI